MSQKETKNPMERDVRLAKSLDDNIAKVKKEFHGVDTLVAREFESQRGPGVRCCIFYTDGLVNSALINENIIRPVLSLETVVATSCMLDFLLTKVLQINEAKKTDDFGEIAEAIVYGDTVLFAQGCDDALVLNTKGWPTRGVSEPEGEKVLQGPREGFTEGLIANLSMLRRRLKTRDLKMEFKVFGRETKTKVCVCYIGRLAKPEILEELNRRLDRFDQDGVLDVNYLSEYIRDVKYSPINNTGSTERPDVVAGKLLEGRIALFMDGTPMVLTLPFLFIENFQSNEDYYVNYWYASFTRMLRIIAFFLTTCIPALYIAAVSTQHELLPTPLLLSISVARQGVPLPSIAEALLMVFMFEVLKETGIRMSSSIGQALSIVGALVVGQAAVEARIVSAPIIIVVAATGITGLLIPRLSLSVIVFRTAFLLLSAALGLFGLVMGLMGLLIYLVDMRSFGLPAFYTASFSLRSRKDTFMRAPWWKMKTRPEGMSNDDVRSGPGEPET